jgi:hypothetical protein
MAEIIDGNSLQPVKDNYLDCRNSTRLIRLKRYQLSPMSFEMQVRVHLRALLFKWENMPSIPIQVVQVMKIWYI